MNIRAISVSNKKTNSINNTKNYKQNVSFRGKLDREGYMAIVEKLIADDDRGYNSLMDIYIKATDILAGVYPWRKSNTPSQFKRSFKTSDGHLSVVYNKDRNILLAREITHQPAKDGENIISYEGEREALMKKFSQEYKNKQGEVVYRGLDTWKYNNNSKEFSYIG